MHSERRHSELNISGPYASIQLKLGSKIDLNKRYKKLLRTAVALVLAEQFPCKS
jgi:hypothetical protein